MIIQIQTIKNLYRYLTLKFSNRAGAFDNPQCPTIKVYIHIQNVIIITSMPDALFMVLNPTWMCCYLCCYYVCIRYIIPPRRSHQ